MPEENHLPASLSRRRLLTTAAALTMAASTEAKPQVKTGIAQKSTAKFPSGFLWGAATAGHQVEGSNTNSDVWLLEHVKPTVYKESSGAACDHYQRFREDIAMLAQLGLNCYRFSVEWSRIEPAPGEFLTSELDHYRRMLAACHEHGVKPVVTFNHYTVPRWFAAQGGWENLQSPDLFANYCTRVNQHLGDLIAVAATLNEPNIGFILQWIPAFANASGARLAMQQAAAAACNAPGFSSLLAGNVAAMQPQLIKAHHQGYAAIKSGQGNYPVGVCLAMIDDQAVGPDSLLAQKRAEVYAPWLAAAAASDFVGVQNYGRSRIDNKGTMKPDAGVALTQTGEEFYPEALERTIRYAAEMTGKPVYVTENGMAIEDDTRRIEYVRLALQGVHRCVADKVDVRGYIHWSLLDNFEWSGGYRPKFGLVAVDRQTQQRTIKPSARFLGSIARANAL